MYYSNDYVETEVKTEYNLQLLKKYLTINPIKTDTGSTCWKPQNTHERNQRPKSMRNE